MANQTVTIPIGKTSTLAIQAFDANGNDISNLVVFTIVSSDPTIVAILGSNGLQPFKAHALKVGSVTVTRTAANASGTVTETDAVSVAIAGPVTESAVYGPPV